MYTVTPATRADLDDIADLLALAFHDDPPTRVVLQPHDDDDMRRRARPFFRASVAETMAAHGIVETIRDNGTILGAATWYLPGGERPSLRSQLPHLTDYARALGVRGLVRGTRIQGQVARHQPQVPSWYLQVIGVSPEARGKGLGGALLSHRLAEIDRRGEAAYLESSTARTGVLYRRHGFETLRPIPLAPGVDPHAMWRSARHSKG